MSATQVVGPDHQRLAIHQRPARRRQRDHAARDVAVQRRDDDGRARARGRARGCPRSARVPLVITSSADAELDRDPLRVGPVADHDHVARLEAASAATRWPSPAPRRGPSPRCSLAATSCSPSSTPTIAPIAVGASPGRDASRDSRTYRRASARSVITPASAPSSSTIGTRSRSSCAIDQADLAHRLAVAGQREALAHDVAHPQQHVRQQLRRRRAAALEHPARLRVQIARAAPARTRCPGRAAA